MNLPSRLRPAFGAALMIAVAILLNVTFLSAQTINQTAKAGPYTINLKVLPAESFTGANAAMHREGGAMPETLNSPQSPNHHMVVFITQNGKPVENATVKIEYRMDTAAQGPWMNLPVVRMDVTGKGPATTHFGNNLHLAPGNYDVRVTVGSAPAASFQFALSQ